MRTKKVEVDKKPAIADAAAVAENEAEPEPKKYVYKGEVISIKELVGKTDVPIQIEDGTAPAVSNQFGVIANASKFPKLIVANSISRYDADTLLLNYSVYLKNWQFGTRYFPNDFKVKVLTGKMGSKIVDKYDEKLAPDRQRNLKHKMTIGSLPEIFVEDKKGVVLPGFVFLGSKKESNKTKQEGEAFGGLPVYWNGFTSRFETAGQGCLSWQMDSVRLGLETILANARKIDAKAKLSLKGVIDVPEDMLKNVQNEHADFGFRHHNVYGLKPTNTTPRKLSHRTATGYIHFGIGKEPKEKVETAVKALDAILGVACVSMFAKFNDNRRKDLAPAGNYRLVPYGFEYGGLSNAWLMAPLITNLVIDVGRKCVALGLQGYLKYWKANANDVVQIINENDVEAARKILATNKDVFCRMINSCYNWATPQDIELVYNIFNKGAETAIANPAKIEQNWCLDEPKKWDKHCDAPFASFFRAREILHKAKKV